MSGIKQLLRYTSRTMGIAVCLFLCACGDSGSGSSTAAQPEPAAATPVEPSVAPETPVAMPASDEPVAETPAATPPAEVADAGIVPEAEGAAPEPIPEATADGGEIYGTYCAVCHRTGLNAAPKYGNNTAWAKVTAQGKDAVYAAALNGVRGMPPRGGVASLTDAEVNAAVDYMVNGSGGWGSAP